MQKLTIILLVEVNSTLDGATAGVGLCAREVSGLYTGTLTYSTVFPPPYVNIT